MDSGGPLEIPPAIISQEDIFNELDHSRLLAKTKRILQAHEAIGQQILELRRQEGIRIPAGFQTERLSEMLEEEYGGEEMIKISDDMRQKGVHSHFYKATKTFFNYFRREGVTEALLRQTWQGRLP
ncbi:hypothetical protein PHJA_001297900 [Phtheirospermum japonicum]|uniref:Uncharacterized protein n=1 Tax=Phtheirospermum japonicum TaxID=374723 RepID=A0A830BYA7_9LAMI|nr:hypothetical protein PHJA_001297900 [Phtheirospermum japonicum]